MRRISRRGRIRRQCLPECGGVLRALVGARREEQAGAAAREFCEQVVIRAEGPQAAVGDEGKWRRDGRPHTWPILQLVVPDAFEARGEQQADAGEHVEIEQRITVGRWGTEFVLEHALGGDLPAQGDGAEVMTEVGEGGVLGAGDVALGDGQVGKGGGLQQPRSLVVILAVAGAGGQAGPAVLGGGEPVEVGGEPCVYGGEIGLGQRGGGGPGREDGGRATSASGSASSRPLEAAGDGAGQGGMAWA